MDWWLNIPPAPVAIDLPHGIGKAPDMAESAAYVGEVGGG